MSFNHTSLTAEETLEKLAELGYEPLAAFNERNWGVSLNNGSTGIGKTLATASKAALESTFKTPEQ